MEQLPLYISIVFAMATLACVAFFYKASNCSTSTLLLLLIWIVVQAMISSTGFYTITDTFPPRFLLLVLPPLLVVTGLFVTPNGRRYLDNLDIKVLTLLHLVRIPVEIVLYWLFLHHAVPQLMTFEGRNVDILAGITAPIIYYFAFVRQQLSKQLLLWWNIACIGALLNIVVNAVLSAPFSFQQFAFDQPNIAILYFPFSSLPSCVVPLVLLSHLATIRQLLLSKNAPSK